MAGRCGMDSSVPYVVCLQWQSLTLCINGWCRFMTFSNLSKHRHFWTTQADAPCITRSKAFTSHGIVPNWTAVRCIYCVLLRALEIIITIMEVFNNNRTVNTFGCVHLHSVDTCYHTLPLDVLLERNTPHTLTPTLASDRRRMAHSVAR